MSEFDDFIRGIGSDIKNAAEQVSKKAEETFEISKRQAEKMRIKGHVQSLYQQLGELTYGGMKNGEDGSEETSELIAKLDEAFFRIEELFEAPMFFRDFKDHFSGLLIDLRAHGESFGSCGNGNMGKRSQFG